MQHEEREEAEFKRQPIQLRQREYLASFAYDKNIHLATQGAKESWCGKELVSNYFFDLDSELAQSELRVFDLCPHCQSRYAYEHPELEKDPDRRFMRWLDYQREEWHSLVDLAFAELDKGAIGETQLRAILTQELTNRAIERTTLLDLETLYQKLIVTARQWQLNNITAELSKTIIQHARLQEEQAKALSTLDVIQARFKLTPSSLPGLFSETHNYPVISLSEIRSYMPEMNKKNSRPNGYTYFQAVEQIIAKEALPRLGFWPINTGEQLYYKNSSRNEPFSEEAYFTGVTFLKQWVQAIETANEQLRPRIEALKSQIEELKKQHLQLDALGREHAKRSHNGRAKLTEEIVRTILQDNTTPSVELARRNGVDHHVISRIRKGLTSKHVKV